MELQSLKSGINTILKCPICYEEFSKKHEPMIIPCGHTICINCVTQIIRLSEEENENYADQEENDEYEDFFNSDRENSNDSSSSSENSQNESQSNNENSEEISAEQEEMEEEEENDDSINLDFEIDDNIKHFNFDCNMQLDENRKKFFMGDESKTDGEEGKLIKFKCSICRKKMKINSKQIIKNIQLAELIKMLDQLNGTTQYLGSDNLKNEININLSNQVDNDNRKNSEVCDLNVQNKKIFCNICKNIFDYKEHFESIHSMSEFHEENIIHMDENIIDDLAEIFGEKENNCDNSINSEMEKDNFVDINTKKILANLGRQKEICFSELNYLFESRLKKIELENKSENIEKRLKIFLKKFLCLSLNYGLSPNEDNQNACEFDFFEDKYSELFFKSAEGRIAKDPIKNLTTLEIFTYLDEVLFSKSATKLKETRIFKVISNFIDAFSNFKKYKHKSFTELSSIYIGFQSYLSNKRFSSAEEKLKKAEKLLEKYFKKFNVLKNNFSLYLKNKLILGKIKFNFNENENEKSKDNQIFTYNIDFCERMKDLVFRKSEEVLDKYFKSGFFTSYLKNTLFSEKRYTVYVYNREYQSKSRAFIFDNLFGENVFCLGFDKLQFCTEKELEEGGPPFNYAQREDVFTTNLVIDDTGLNIFFLGSNKNSKNFRMYSLAKKVLIELPKIPEEYFTTDSIYYEGKVFILGGCNIREQPIQNCYYYHIEKKQWENMPPLRIARYSKGAFVRNNMIYVYGGVCGYENDRSQNQDIFRTQLWKFEVFNLESLKNKDNSATWKTVEIGEFKYRLSEFGYGLIDSDKLLILGGIQEENEYYFRSGFIIDLENSKIFEKLKIEYDIDNHDMNCNFYRGGFHVLLDEENQKMIKYNRNFENLDIFIG